MVEREFRTTAEELKTWIRTLASTADGILPEVQRMLEGGQSENRENDAEFALRQISTRIANVMSAFDAVLLSINRPPEYKSYLDLRK